MAAMPIVTMQGQVPDIQQQLPEGVVVMGDAEEDVGDNNGELQTVLEAVSSGNVCIIKISHTNKIRWSSTYYICSRIYLQRQASLQYMVEVKAPPGWELTPSKFDLIANLVDVLRCVATYNTAIQANKEPLIHTALPAVLRLTQQILKTTAKGMWLKRKSRIKVMDYQD